MRSVPLFAVILIAAGCAQKGPSPAALTDAAAACQGLATAVSYWSCANREEKALYLEQDSPDLDVINLWHAYRLALARQLDSGALSRERHDLVYAEAEAEVAAELEARYDARRLNRAPSQPSLAALIDSFTAFNYAYGTSITCQQSGVVTTCF